MLYNTKYYDSDKTYREMHEMFWDTVLKLFRENLEDYENRRMIFDIIDLKIDARIDMIQTGKIEPDSRRPVSNCYLCEMTKHNRETNCDKCPLKEKYGGCGNNIYSALVNSEELSLDEIEEYIIAIRDVFTGFEGYSRKYVDGTGKTYREMHEMVWDTMLKVHREYLEKNHEDIDIVDLKRLALEEIYRKEKITSKPPIHNCYLCQYQEYEEDGSCSGCPLNEVYGSCFWEGSIYDSLSERLTPEEFERCIIAIRDIFYTAEEKENNK